MAGDTLERATASLGVGAIQVIILYCGVAASADVVHFLEARRSRTVATVTGRTGRRSDILITEQDLAVDTPSVEVELVGGQVVGGHPSLAGVTTGARVGYVGRIDGRGRVVDFEYLVPTVAIEASSWVGVALGKLVTMDAFFMLDPLVGGQVVLAHPSYVSVATGAQGGDVGPGRHADIIGLERLCRLHSDAG